ncbi:MAG: bifunctional acetate--CoA ligase family protein/GNAT family N-acetyltransferase [Betaproteobacteria bacterium]|nr:bifunctional acetate--CoA ligase family protein/GNAT family N-acetyltransferase [Betaproteobacteria bacterium]
MTLRNLYPLLAPQSVAVIGASERTGRLGTVLLRNLIQSGFKGPVWPVNPKHREVQGLPAWPDLRSLPQPPDLAVICTPPETVVDLISQLGRKGTKAAVVITAGLKKAWSPDPSRSTEQAMLEAARPHLLRILGPNCIGVLTPAVGLNASFAPSQALPGWLAFLTQSGALATALLDWAKERGIGFSHFISLGDSADVDFGDLLDYLATDAQTQAILLYVESIRHARKFMSAARAAARNKPVILVKAGRAPEGARAAASHTGALAGSDEVYEAAFRRAGLLRVDTLEALFDAAQTLSHCDSEALWSALKADRMRLAILTNGGGAGVLAADALSLGGGRLAQLSTVTLASLDQGLPATWSRDNPVDIIGDAPIERYVHALGCLLAAEEVDGLLFMHAPTAVVPASDIALACLPALKQSPKPVLCCWLGGQAVASGRQLCHEAHVASHATPERSIAAWLQLCRCAHNQRLLNQWVGTGPPDLAGAVRASQALIERARQDQRLWLGDADSMRLLQLWGLPVLQTRACATVEEAVLAAQQMSYPVALKIASPDILHKSDVGGVMLGIRGPAYLRQSAECLRDRFKQRRPDARLEGYTVQAMAQARDGQRELIVGLKVDPLFGPVLLLGQGGMDVELHHRHALALPPLNEPLAQDLIERSGIEPWLAGHRGRPPARRQALVETLLKLSQLVSRLPDVAEFDINPLGIDDLGVMAIDARIRLRASQEVLTQLAILPYPEALEETVVLGTRTLTLRPIRPEDASALKRFYASASSQDLRLRFLAARREVPLSELARYSQTDYDREMTLVLMAAGEGANAGEMIGEVRAVCDPDRQRAEFAAQIARGSQGQGLGLHLMRKVIGYLRDRGVQELHGACLLENQSMLALARRPGFSVRAQEGTAELVLALGEGTPIGGDQTLTV